MPFVDKVLLKAMQKDLTKLEGMLPSFKGPMAKSKRGQARNERESDVAFVTLWALICRGMRTLGEPMIDVYNQRAKNTQRIFRAMTAKGYWEDKPTKKQMLKIIEKLLKDGLPRSYDND